MHYADKLYFLSQFGGWKLCFFITLYFHETNWSWLHESLRYKKYRKYNVSEVESYQEREDPKKYSYVVKSPSTSNDNGDISKTDSNGESLNKIKENGPNNKMRKYMYKLKPSDDPKSDVPEENSEKDVNNEQNNSKQYAYVLYPVQERHMNINFENDT